MSRVEDARLEAERRLAASRRRAEECLSEVRAAVEMEIGWRPSGTALLLVAAAGAGGLALALRLRERRRRRRRREARQLES